MIKSEDISGDTGAVAVEELGRSGVGNPAVELSKIGGQCTGAGGVGAALNYQTMINDVQLEHIHRRTTLDAVRQVAREELAAYAPNPKN